MLEGEVRTLGTGAGSRDWCVGGRKTESDKVKGLTGTWLSRPDAPQRAGLKPETKINPSGRKRK